MEIKLTQITEGKTRLFVPDLSVYKLPEHAPVFYNPAMKTDRDISVAVLKNFLKKKAKVADIMCSIGARAVRYANECRMDVYANDIQPSAIKLAKRNAKLNKAKIKTSVNEANLFLMESKYDKFDCIDIDPFGSPAPFLNSAMRAISPKSGLLCITATDIGVLSGNYPVVCFRKYFIKSGRSSFEHELGVRNLITAVFKESAKYNFSIEPLLSYASRHYYRTFVKITGGRKTVNRDIRNLGYVIYCRKCENRETRLLFDSIPEKCSCGNKLEVFGPTWLSNIGDKNFIEKIKHENRIIDNCYHEADMPSLYYDTHVLARVSRKKTVLGTDELIEKLENSGYKAVRTQFSSHGIKTNADYKTVRKLQ
jgi:tRNA (guanine26-N2/guanine27-N2)-dimethyltransferase